MREQKILGVPDLCHRYGRDKTTIYRWQREQLLPPPDVRISNRKGWYLSTLVAFEASTVGRREQSGEPAASCGPGAKSSRAGRWVKTELDG